MDFLVNLPIRRKVFIVLGARGGEAGHARQNRARLGNRRATRPGRFPPPGKMSGPASNAPRFAACPVIVQHVPVTANTRCGTESGSAGKAEARSATCAASKAATASRPSAAPTPALALIRPAQAAWL